jgi:hypothetical protein
MVLVEGLVKGRTRVCNQPPMPLGSKPRSRFVIGEGHRHIDVKRILRRRTVRAVHVASKVQLRYWAERHAQGALIIMSSPVIIDCSKGKC